MCFLRERHRPKMVPKMNQFCERASNHFVSSKHSMGYIALLLIIARYAVAKNTLKHRQPRTGLAPVFEASAPSIRQSSNLTCGNISATRCYRLPGAALIVPVGTTRSFSSPGPVQSLLLAEPKLATRAVMLSRQHA